MRVQPDHPDRKISLDESIRRFKSESLDFLYSVDGKGDKNGAQCVVKEASCIMTGVVNNKDFIIDDCTNIHYLEDLELAKSKDLEIKISKVNSDCYFLLVSIL